MRGFRFLLNQKMKETFFLLSLGWVLTPGPRKTGESCRLEKNLLAITRSGWHPWAAEGEQGRSTGENHRADWFHCEVWSPRQMRCQLWRGNPVFPNQPVVQFPEITVLLQYSFQTSDHHHSPHPCPFSSIPMPLARKLTTSWKVTQLLQAKPFPLYTQSTKISASSVSDAFP